MPAYLFVVHLRGFGYFIYLFFLKRQGHLEKLERIRFSEEMTGNEIKKKRKGNVAIMSQN